MINDYLCVNSQVRNRGFHALTSEECSEMFHRLESFERPDMYAELDDKIVILEHFEFDASKSTRKGMHGKREEALLEDRIRAAPYDGTMYVDSLNYSISLKNWQANFEYGFISHYKKIPAYKDHIVSILGQTGKPFVVGFFTENQFAPYVEIDGRILELPYVYTKQFADLFSRHTNLDFVLLGGYANGVPQLTYVDHEGWKSLPEAVDLDSEGVSLSSLNKNEVVMYGGFEMPVKDI